MYKFRILIVEDNNLYRTTFRESLQTSFPGVAIDEAKNGVEAWQRVEVSYPDLIFMDLSLYGDSGLKLTQRIKAAYPDITIFVLTHFDTPECREAAFKYGADRFINKDSINSKKLEKLVRSYYKI